MEGIFKVIKHECLNVGVCDKSIEIKQCLKFENDWRTIKLIIIETSCFCWKN